MSEQSSYCPFVVGQHVVCVDAADADGTIVLGAVYTIAAMAMDVALFHGEIICGVGLQFGATPAPYWPGAHSYYWRRFRPAPSIAALTELLNKAPVKEDAHV